MSRTHRTKEDRINSAEAHYTPPGLALACIRQLVADRWIRWPERTRVLEPSCGRCAWIRALLANQFSPGNITANDNDPDLIFDLDLATGLEHAVRFTRYDFTRADRVWAQQFDLIVGNPPFNDAGSHIETAFDHVTPTGVVAYLLPIGWFTARGSEDQRQIWIRQDAAPSHHYIVTPRPSFSGGSTDAATYTLAIWAPGARNNHTTTSSLDWSAEADAEKQLRAEARKEARKIAKAARRAA